MLIQFGTALGNYLYDVFVAKFDFWLVFGFVAQLVFTARFLVQWIASERAGKSVMPMAFWFFSIGGGTMLLVYGARQREPVFIVGQALGLVIYVRNHHAICEEPMPADRRRWTGDQAAFERLKAAVEIGLEVLDILKPDVQPQRRAARRPFGRGAIFRCSRTE